MKCQCETCRGSGEIECPDCDGDGDYDAGIEAAELDKNALKTLRPDRAGSYDMQLQAALHTINLQAEKAAKK